MLIICSDGFAPPPPSCNRKPNYHLERRRVIHIAYLKSHNTSKLRAAFFVLVRSCEESLREKLCYVKTNCKLTDIFMSYSVKL